MIEALLNERAGGWPASGSRNGAVPAAGVMCECESRAPLLKVSVGLVEDLRRAGMRPGKGPEAFCAEFQICLPYRGVFVWHVGGDDVVGDANQVVFVRGGEEFCMSGPLPDGYAELIVTPDVEVLSEIAHTPSQPLFRHPLFRRRSWSADPRVQSFRARFLHWARGSSRRDGLEGEEGVLALLRLVFEQTGARETPGTPNTARLIRRAKEFLEANASRRILLADVAGAVGASPAYLTDLFRRVEGVSLHQYLTRLRLARALDELPHAGDITALALELGFSSHSHFSFVFRRTFGCTPSQFRETAGRLAHPERWSQSMPSWPDGSMTPGDGAGQRLSRHE